MLKILARIAIILLASGLLSTGLYYLVNGSAAQGGLITSSPGSDQIQPNYERGLALPGSQDGQSTGVQPSTRQRGPGGQHAHGGTNLGNGFSGILQNLVVIGLITIIVIPTRRVLTRLSHQRPLKTT
jgi:hypothetical protein